MELKEIRTVLTESSFTNICKIGYITYQSKLSGKMDVRFSTNDISIIANGEILEKQVDDAIFKFALQDIGYDSIREILKRSPIYYELSNQF